MKALGTIILLFFFVLCAGSTILIMGLFLFWLRASEHEPDNWEEYCDHMLHDAPGSCSRCEGT